MSQISLRTARDADATAIAAVHIASRQTAMPYLPVLHSEPEVIAYFKDIVLRDQDVRVAVDGGRIAGFIAFGSEWVHHLYVHPDCQGAGIGSSLLDKAKSGGGGRLRLWVFQRNSAAREFYERRGFRLVETTDGSANEEGEPDALYEWSTAERS